ncbi:hypothetical protein AAFF_G00437640 [Aldrovandia affinis]|uniref:E3 ubiquitin-protein ligase SH3RF1 n=1 Tax=Aldrovandia affinis TaxID=143900 RepID=A0AAD7S818_9TELE|nr:hypothetical protein AAFF_G00437640 [Aldrovandia affinis]
MDEAALLDLLECPVCLERLDASAKVLPCQHTFCRRCLQGIMTSRGELRCPECRTLVDVGVDELPSNILLVRLLDGIKQRPWRPGGGGGGGASNGTNSAARGQVVGQREQGIPGLPLQRVQAKSTAVRGVLQLPCAKALYNYDGKEPGDLKFSKGDIIILRRQVDENWHHGEVGGVHGFFPTNFVQILKPLPQPPPQCKALYDFEVKDKEADKDCLPFSKDDILTVIRRVDENWAEGMLGDKIGIFPISYVEFNSAARQLIEWDKPLEGCVDLGEGPSGYGKGGEGKKNTKKRHSFTSLSMSSKASQAPPHRHSMEISGPRALAGSHLHIGADCDSTPKQSCHHGNGVHIPAGDELRVHTSGQSPPPPPPPQSSAVGAASSLGTGQRPSPSTSDPSGRQRPTVYVAVFPYSPRKEDELELRKGEMFLVLERCQDGWFKGTSLHTGKIGVFPGNYMSPVNRTGANCTLPKVPLGHCTAAARGVTILAPSCDPSKPLTPGPGTAPAAVMATTHLQAPPTKVLMHMTGQMTVNQARNAVRTASCHSQERPTAAVTPVQVQTPAAWKEGEEGIAEAAVHQEEAPPLSAPSPTLESEQPAVEGAVGPELPSPVAMGRAGSCPAETDPSLSLPCAESSQRKSGPPDSPAPIAPPPRQPCSSLLSLQQDSRPILCERYRVLVPYPPQSEAELELKEGDIVFVHKKREDGWFKGTLQRNGRTGLFPGSFVLSI